MIVTIIFIMLAKSVFLGILTLILVNHTILLSNFF